MKKLTSGSNGLGNLSLKLLRNYVPGCQAAVPGVIFLKTHPNGDTDSEI